MTSRKASNRQRVLKRGSITFDGVGAIDCTIRNISSSGACLEVASPVGIPDNFILVVDRDKLKRPSKVVWRAAQRIGIMFVD